MTLKEILQKRGLEEILSLNSIARAVRSKGTKGQIIRLAQTYSPTRSPSAIAARVNYNLSDVDRLATIRTLEDIRDAMALAIADLKEL